MPQPGEDPALDQQHGGFDLGLVLRFARPRRQDGAAVMLGQRFVGAIGNRLVAIRVANQGAWIIRHQQRRGATKEGERVAVGGDPVGLRLGRRGLGIGVVRGAPHRDEDVRAADLATGRVDQRDRRPGVIDEQLLAGDMRLPHRAAQPLPKLAVALAEARPAVGNALGLRPILLPQQLQRDALAPQLAMNLTEIRNGKLRVDVALRMQACVQRRIIEPERFTVRQSGGGGGGKVIRHRALRDAQRGSDLGVGQRAFVLETENFSNSAHGNPVGWHRRLPEQKGASVPSRRFELPRTATSPLRSRPRFPGIVTANPTNLTALSDVPAKSGHHPSDSPVNIVGSGGHHPSETAVTFRRNTHSQPGDVSRLRRRQ